MRLPGPDRRLVAVTVLAGVVAVGALVARRADPPPAGAAAPAPSPTYVLPARTARPFETPLSVGAASGRVSFSVLGLRAQMPSIIGTHAEWEAKGAYVRLRVAAQNDDLTFHDVATADQVLVTTGGRTFRPDYSAMQIARQPARLSLGRGDRFEIDLYFDVPTTATAAALRVRQADGPAVDIPLPPS